MRQYDVAVLGGGPGGYAAALRAALRGAKVCCIERGRLGGTCLNVGCIPTKAMLHASEWFHLARHAGALGFRGGEMTVDGRAFMARVTGTVDKLVTGLEGLVKARKIDLIAGRGRLIGSRRIAVEIGSRVSDPAAAAGQRPAARNAGETPAPQAIEAKAIILATGSRPARPGLFPWGRRVFTTDEAAVADWLPASVIIVGGGVIGCEFATFYSELGIRTAVVEMLDELLKGFDADAVRAVNRSLKARGVEVVTGQKIVSMAAGAEGVRAVLADGRAIQAEASLVAVGRATNVEDIGLEAAGVKTRDGLVSVDERCRTNVEGIYAVGDVAVSLQYAHLATRMGLVAADNATGREASDDRTVVPIGVYTHPEIASVGLTEAKARAVCPQVRVAKFPYLASGMAQAYGQTEGLVKLMGDPAGGRLLGGLVIGQHATDVIQEITVAMRQGVTIERLAETIHPHPTFAEAVGDAAEAWMGLPLHLLK